MNGDGFDGHEQLSDTIGLIYDSASCPELWPELLAKLDTLAVAYEQPENNGLAELIPEKKSYNQLLRQHFKRALTMNKKLYGLQVERDAISEILDRLPIGVVLVDMNQTPVAMNQHARDFIGSKNILSVQHGKLVTSSRQSTTELHRIVTQVITEPAGLSPEKNGETFLLDSRSSTPCSLHITPSSHAQISVEKGLAAIFIASSDIRQPISSESLMTMYGLTVAEARLLQRLLITSNTLPEAAAELGVSIHTVRTQVKVIYEKTDTHSQSELIKKVLCSASSLIGQKQSTLPVSDLQALESTSFIEQDADDAFNIITLIDGRKLEYTEFGDPEGRPLIYFHGILHSREAFHPYSTFAEEHGIRIIAPERPGFGHTSPQKTVSLSNYSKDIEQLADHLALEVFHVFGDGDAGPAALACANLLPHRVCRAAVTGCMPEPQFEFMEDMLPFDRKLHNMAKMAPKSVLYPFSKIVLKALKKNNNYFDLMASDFYETDKAILFSDEHKNIFRQTMENLDISPDNTDGFIRDYFGRLTPWDFQVEKTGTEVHLWHGRHDCFSTIKSAIAISEALPNCVTHFMESDGHYLFISHIDQVLEALFKDDAC